MSKKKIDSAINSINSSQLQLDSLKRSIEGFKTDVANIQSAADRIDAAKNVYESKSDLVIKELRKKADVLKAEIDKNDSPMPKVEFKSL